MDDRKPPRAAPKATGDTPPAVYSTDRRCSSCGTLLARYNAGPECYIHRQFKKPRIRGKDRR